MPLLEILQLMSAFAAASFLSLTMEYGDYKISGNVGQTAKRPRQPPLKDIGRRLIS